MRYHEITICICIPCTCVYTRIICKRMLYNVSHVVWRYDWFGHMICMSVLPEIITFTATLHRYGEALPRCSLCTLDHWKQHSRDTCLLGCAFDLRASISCTQGWWETWSLRFDPWVLSLVWSENTCPIVVDGCFFAMLCVLWIRVFIQVASYIVSKCAYP